jgi:hypothetical protein
MTLNFLTFLKNILVILSVILVSGCIEPFDVTIAGGNNRLIVEGLITDEPGPYTVKLSRSSLLNEGVFPPVTNAVVRIEEENGESETLRETGSGIYQTSSLQGKTGERYRLLVTIDGSNRYETDWTLLKPSPSIDSVYSEFQETLVDQEQKVGFQFYLDASDPNNETIFCRYEWTEAWIYVVPKPSTSIYLGNDQVIPIPGGGNPACWEFEEFTGISIANSVSNSDEVISRQPLLFVSNDPEKLQVRYGLKVRQYAVTEEEYRFWEGLRETSSESGSLFDVQPQEVRSNLRNINNPDEAVFGYFSVSGVSTGAGFVDFEDLSGVGVEDLYTDFCNSEAVFIPKSSSSEQEIQELLDQGLLFLQLEFSLIPTIPKEPIGYSFTTPFCGDCEARGGTTQAPDWWIP